MPVILSQPDLSRWTLETICSTVGRAANTKGVGCMAHLVFFAADLQWGNLGSGTDNKSENYFMVTCPSCKKILLLRDEEIDLPIQLAVIENSAPPPNPELLHFFTSWRRTTCCGGKPQSPMPGYCSKEFIFSAGDLIYNGKVGGPRDQQDSYFFAVCPYCKAKNLVPPVGIPEFVLRGARMRFEISNKS